MKKYYKRNNGSEAFVEVVGIHESGDYLCKWLFDTGEPFRYHKYEFDQEFVEVGEEVVNLVEKQRCPRRDESSACLDEGLVDYWKELPNGDRVCSFCGSLHPDTVLDIVRKEGQKAIDTTDKGYKWYIKREAVQNALQGGIKYYRQHDTQEFIDKLNEIISGKK